MGDADVAMTLIEQLGYDADRAFEAVKHNTTLDAALDWLEEDQDHIRPRDEGLEGHGASVIGNDSPSAHAGGGKAAAQYPSPGGSTYGMRTVTVNDEPVPNGQNKPPACPAEKVHSANPPENGSLSKPSEVPQLHQNPPSYVTDENQSSYAKTDGKSPYPTEGNEFPPHQLLRSKSKYMSGRDIAGPATGALSQDDPLPGGAKLLFKRIIRDKKAIETHMQRKQDSADQIMQKRWGPPGSPRYDMIMRYWTNTHMKPHWIDLFENNPNDFKRMIDSGYCEPIPTAWVVSRQLAYLYPEGSYFETPAEKRLYYFLNNGQMPGIGKHPPLRPLNINRDRNTIIRRGNERNARARPLDAARLKAYASPGDVFQADKQIKSHQYSPQVDNVVYEARAKALHELADAIIHGTDHLETMILVDVSGSMSWNPHGGITGPDGITRYHDQPSNIRLVEHLIHRVLQHMVPRAQKEHPNQLGIDTVTFSNRGTYIGHLTAHDFKRDWSRVRLGGGTQVMSGWQVVKTTYFEHQHRTYGHGRYDQVYGWQPTPGMPKLSLLLFLDGECQDMDEFELELLGESWAYVTVALVGMEGCPHHHSHAIELERVAKFNPHVGFFDVHGRVCERMCVEDLLKSVYPVDPPAYEEILKPEFDLPAEQLPAYSA